MSLYELLGYEANLPRLEARRTRRGLAGRDVRLTVDQVYDLVLAETEDPAAASKAASQYAAALLRRGERPE